MERMEQLMLKMMQHTAGDAKRTQHFLKVHALARLIGREERLDTFTQFILETAALVHDIGIYAAIEKHGSSAGTFQKAEGPALAKEMLSQLDYSEEIIDRVLFLVAHHHSTDWLGEDHRILLEADYLVNFYEEGFTKEQIQTTYDTVFQTTFGRYLCQTMYGLS